MSNKVMDVVRDVMEREFIDDFDIHAHLKPKEFTKVYEVPEGEAYWVVNNYGYVQSYIKSTDDLDEHTIDRGVFLSRPEAEYYRVAENHLTVLKARARDLNEKRGVCQGWADDRYNYFMYFNHDKAIVDYACHRVCEQGLFGVYVKDVSDIIELIRMFTYEEFVEMGKV